MELTEAGRTTWLGAMDAVGHEEYRLLGALPADERSALASMLRRVMLVAERKPDAGAEI